MTHASTRHHLQLEPSLPFAFHVGIAHPCLYKSPIITNRRIVQEALLNRWIGDIKGEGLCCSISITNTCLIKSVEIGNTTFILLVFEKKNKRQVPCTNKKEMFYGDKGGIGML
ncbi:hypothetical protein ACJX0J_020077 [Zea mays]